MGSGVTVYIQGLIKIGSAIQKLIGGIHRHTDIKMISKPTFILKDITGRDPNMAHEGVLKAPRAVRQ
jgi:hypothetical protein